MPINLPAQVVLPDRVGDGEDTVTLLINGQEIGLYESYDIQLAVIQQPAAFSLRLGWSNTAALLLEVARPGLEFALQIAGVTIQSGRIDARQLRRDADGTYVEVRGRDWMAAVYDSFVQEERSFANKTYYELTRTILDICGLKDRGLIAGDDIVFKKAITGTNTVKVINEETIRAIPVDATPEAANAALAAATTSKIVNKTLKVKLGERWFDWLQRQYKLKGLFLFCTGEGNFVLTTPQWDQKPAYTILVSRGISREFATVLSCDFKDDTTNRFAKVRVHGRTAGGKAGRTTLTGEHIDQEMVDRGFVKEYVVHDDDCKTKSEAEFIAIRSNAEARRGGWSLSYTVAGHTVPSLTGSGVAVWNPDNVVRVSDDEIPIDGELYLESVAYRRDSGGTTTQLTMMRPEDLVFAKPELVHKKAPKPRRAPKG